MTNEQRQKICDLITGPLPKDEVLSREFSAYGVMYTYAIEPVIDEIERNAEARGRFRAMLEAYAFHNIPMLDYLGVKKQDQA
jgi:hypothetical protein